MHQSDFITGPSGSSPKLFHTPDLSGPNVSHFCWLPTRLAARWLPHESGESERIRPHLTPIGMRDYSWRYPRGSYIQESRFDLGNPGSGRSPLMGQPSTQGPQRWPVVWIWFIGAHWRVGSMSRGRTGLGFLISLVAEGCRFDGDRDGVRCEQ